MTEVMEILFLSEGGGKKGKEYYFPAPKREPETTAVDQG